ncbi:MAG: TonB-dependent receptor, partial [Bacteroidales bacterium]|nr:TonB-dependent receptor [Bacteroidales bacterium]
MNKYTARGGISPITGYLSVGGPIQKDKSSFILSARSTYSDWMLKRMEDPELRNSEAGFYDLGGTLTYEPGDKTLIKVFGYVSRDRFKLGTSNEYAYDNSGASINMRYRFNPRITGDFALVYGQYDFRTVDMKAPSESYAHEYRIGHSELKADLSWLSLGSHKLTYGGSAIYYNLDRGTVEPYGLYSIRAPLALGIENGVETSIYIADEMTLTPRLTVYTGLRFATYMSLGPDQVRIYEEGQPHSDYYVVDTMTLKGGAVARAYYGVEPRISINYMVGDNNSLKFSYNRIRQFLFMLSNTIAISPTDQWK